MRLDDKQLKRIFPTLPAAKRATYSPLLIAAMEEFAINTRRRACAFLAQVGHESADLKYMQELASGAAYEGRRDLGNTQKGDGRKFKGRGPIQITGRTNYLKAGDALQLDLLTHPELLEIPANGFRASTWWWKAHGLNAAADRLTLKADDRDLKQFDKTTKTINGGYNGRVDRQRRYMDCIEVTSEEDFTIRSGPLPGDHVIPPPPPPPSQDPSGPTNESALGRLASDPTRRSLLTKAGQRIGTPLTTLITALAAGNVYAWLGVAIVVIGLGVFIYLERRAISRVFQKITARFH